MLFNIVWISNLTLKKEDTFNEFTSAKTNGTCVV